MPWEARRKWAWIQRVIADHKTHLMMGICECRSWSSRSSGRLLQLEERSQRIVINMALRR